MPSANSLSLNNVAFLGRTGGALAFVGPLDELIAQGATLRHASSVRRLLSSYTGTACRLREEGTNTEANIPFLANGALDLSVVDTLQYVAAGDGAPGPFSVNWTIAYDQSGFGRDAQQGSWAFQPPFGTSVEARGAMQGTGNNRFLDVNLTPTGGNNNRPFFVLAVVNIAASSVGIARYLLGSSGSGSYYVRQSATSFQSAWPTQLSSGIGLAGKKTLGAWVNFTSSTNYINGVYQTEGDTGSLTLDSLLPIMRIGRGSLATQTWFNQVNNTISEFLVFNNDPTLLAGWPAFVAAQNAHFGIV